MCSSDLMAWEPKTEKLSGLVSIVEWLRDCAINGKILDKDKNILKINDLISKFDKD